MRWILFFITFCTLILEGSCFASAKGLQSLTSACRFDCLPPFYPVPSPFRVMSLFLSSDALCDNSNVSNSQSQRLPNQRLFTWTPRSFLHKWVIFLTKQGHFDIYWSHLHRKMVQLFTYRGLVVGSRSLGWRKIKLSLCTSHSTDSVNDQVVLGEHCFSQNECHSIYEQQNSQPLSFYYVSKWF